MQKLGQHFLKNKAALRLIIEALDLKPQEIVIEIGPGHGELTEEGERKMENGEWIAIEKDHALAEALKKQSKTNGCVKIIESDALKFLKDGPSSILRTPYSFKLAGNIPYYITGHLLRILSELEHKPELCVFTIQKEVAERIIAKPPHMNRLAASVQFWAEPKILKILPAEDFSPPPKVESAIIKLANGGRRAEGGEKYYATVRTLFAQPRKTILNNLTSAKKESGPQLKSRDYITKFLEALKIDPSARPQDLQIADIVSISEALSL
ncbi:MAG: ribosomal RNA small subunit methyltransferase A [Patescibacteria group bacterium]|nr:ribosomal RNA small subunit methyltransferase A [Patescibacteria group bacterium]